MTAFRVGMKVVAIKSEWETIGTHFDGPDPQKGVVYTVDDIEHDFDGAYLVLAEFGDDFAFNSEGFRPIVSRPTSIAVFQAMLTGKKAGVEA